MLAGVERLQQFIVNCHLEPFEFIQTLHQEVLAFARGTIQADDLTAVITSNVFAATQISPGPRSKMEKFTLTFPQLRRDDATVTPSISEQGALFRITVEKRGYH